MRNDIFTLTDRTILALVLILAGMLLGGIDARAATLAFDAVRANHVEQVEEVEAPQKKSTPKAKPAKATGFSALKQALERSH